MKTFWNFFQIFISLVLIVLVLIQAKGEGFGGNFSWNFSKKRGIELLIFRITIIAAFLFLLSSIIQLVLVK